MPNKKNAIHAVRSGKVWGVLLGGGVVARNVKFYSIFQNLSTQNLQKMKESLIFNVNKDKLTRFVTTMPSFDMQIYTENT